MVAACGLGEGSGSALDALPEGAEVEPGGKGDGDAQLIFGSADLAAGLLYVDPTTPEEETWAEGDLAEIFGQRLRPGGTADAPWTTLRRSGPLGYYGPLGPYGPLGVFGPIGDNVWNPSALISGGVPWDDLAAHITDAGGPLSADGPLGEDGAMNVATWGPFEAEWEAAHPGNLNAVHLRPGGLFAMLGQSGPLSPAGPLGPVGPIGGHGFSRTDGGDYKPSGDACTFAPEGREAPPCRAVQLDFSDEEQRTWDLVELYDAAHAAQLRDNDASFIAAGSMRADDDAHRFEFTSTRDQWVSVLVLPEFAKFPPFQAASLLAEGEALPERVTVRHALFPWRTEILAAQLNPFICNFATFLSNPWCRATGLSDTFEIDYEHRAAFDDFDLTLDVEGGGTITSESADTLDWVTVRVPAGTALRASVSLASTWKVTADDERWGLDLFIESAEWADAFTASDIEFEGGRPVPRYRLVVVGSTEYVETGDVTFAGPHLAEL